MYFPGPRSFTGGGARPHTPSSLRSHKSGRSADADKLSRPPRSHSNQLPLEASSINKQVASVMAAASRPRSDTQSPKVAPPQQSSPSISLTSVAGVSTQLHFRLPLCAKSNKIQDHQIFSIVVLTNNIPMSYSDVMFPLKLESVIQN